MNNNDVTTRYADKEDVWSSIPPQSPFRVRPVTEHGPVLDSTRVLAGDSIIGAQCSHEAPNSKPPNNASLVSVLEELEDSS